MAEDIGLVEAGTSGVALGDPGALGGPGDAAPWAAGGFAKVAGLGTVDGGKETKDKEAHGGLAQGITAEAIAEGS